MFADKLSKKFRLLHIHSSSIATNVLITSYDGLVLVKYELLGVGVNKGTKNLNITYYFYDIDGNGIGSYVQTLVNNSVVNNLSSSSFTSLVTDRHTVTRAGLKAFNPFKALPHKLMFNLMKAYSKRPSKGKVKIGEDVVTPISKSYPPVAFGQYVVKQGDTLESIAQAVYGDASDADAIGSSCGVSDGSIAPGQVLQLPELMPMQFQAGDAPAYDRFKETILNNFYPYLKIRQPSEGPWWSEVIHIVVDVAAAIVGYAVGGPMGAAVFTTIADAAYQEVAVDVGWQDHFSVKQAIVTGVEAGVEAAILPPDENLAQMPFKEAVAKCASIVIANQMIEMAAGERDTFNFGEALADIAAMLATSRIDAELPQAQKSILATTAINEVVSSGIQAAAGERVSVSDIAANIIGTTAGTYLGQGYSPQAVVQDIAEAPVVLSELATQTEINVSTALSRMGMFSRSSSVSQTQAAVAGTPTTAPRQTTPMQSQASSAAASGGYGTGNATATSKLSSINSSTNDLGIAYALADAEALADTPISQLAPDPGLFPTSQNASSVNYPVIIRMDAAVQAGISNGLGVTNISTNNMNGLEEANYALGVMIGGAGRWLIPELRVIPAISGLVSKFSDLWESSNTITTSPGNLSYSQQSISYLKQRPGLPSYTVDDIISSMQMNGWIGDPIDAVKMPNGSMITIDNTRVFAANEAGIDVQANIWNYNDSLPDDMFYRFQHPAIEGVFAQTWGEAVEFRIMGQSLDFQNTNIFTGSSTQPNVTYSVKNWSSL